MGQTDSHLNPESQKELNFLHSANLNYLGDVQVMQDPKTKSIVCLKEMYFNTEEDYTSELMRLKEAKKRKSNSLIEILDVKGLSSVKLCSSSFKVILVTEYMKKTLSQEIMSRRKDNLVFTKEDILDLLISGANLISFCMVHGQKLGNLKSSLIWIGNSKEFKFAENWMIRSIPLYTQCLSGNTERGVYLAPEFMESLKEKDCYPIQNFEKADIFTLGCIAIEMATLSEQNGLFNYKTCTFNESNLINSLQEVCEMFGSQLSEILRMMTEPSVKKRIDSRKLKEILVLKKETLKSTFQTEKENILLPPELHKKMVESSVIEDSMRVKSLKNSMNLDTSRLSEIKINENNAMNSRLMTPAQIQEIFNDFPKDNSSDKEFLKTKEMMQETLFYGDGSIYNGEILNGYRHGQGTFTFIDGGKYNGEWFYNKMHGFGSLFYPSGKLAYEGSWKDGQLDGFGTLYNEKPNSNSTPNQNLSTEIIRNFDLLQDFWKFYSGNFQNDCKHGKGTLVFTNGDVFEGEFSDDYIHGWGIIKKDGKEYVRGKWIYNKLLL